MTKVRHKIQISFFIIVLAILTYLLLKNSGEFFAVLHRISNADFLYLFIALILQFIYIAPYAQFFQLNYEYIGLKFKLSDMYYSILKMYFFNLIASIGGIGGTISFMDTGRRQKHSLAKTGVGYIIVSVFNFFIIGIFVFLSAFILSLRHELTNYGKLETGLYAIFLTAVLVAFFLAIASPHLLHQLLHKVADVINNFVEALTGKHVINKESITKKMEHYLDLRDLLKNQYIKHLKITPLLLIAHLIQVFIVIITFGSIGMQISYIDAFIVYSTVVLVSIISPTPQGAGIVEGSVPLILKPMGFELSEAITAIMLYRLVSLWIPVIVGYTMTVVDIRHLFKKKVE
ncbi:MAG: lysylphosphatidylglycerol synthase transmembrane domain-containing protein [bacterium]